MNERDYLHQLAGCNDEIIGLRARAERAEQRSEQLGQRLRDRTGEWKLALHERDEFRQRCEALRAALERFYWFYMMVKAGGPDGSDLDLTVSEDAEEAEPAARALLALEVTDD